MTENNSSLALTQEEFDAACHRAYKNGLTSMHIAIQASLNGMPHMHNPDVLQQYQRNYCWRCLLEEVLVSTEAEYSQLSGGQETTDKLKLRELTI